MCVSVGIDQRVQQRVSCDRNQCGVSIQSRRRSVGQKTIQGEGHPAAGECGENEGEGVNPTTSVRASGRERVPLEGDLVRVPKYDAADAGVQLQHQSQGQQKAAAQGREVHSGQRAKHAAGFSVMQAVPAQGRQCALKTRNSPANGQSAECLRVRAVGPVSQRAMQREESVQGDAQQREHGRTERAHQQTHTA